MLSMAVVPSVPMRGRGSWARRGAQVARKGLLIYCVSRVQCRPATMTSDVVLFTKPSPGVDAGAHAWALDDVVCLVQNYTKNWPEPLRHPRNAHIAASDTDRGFERLLREMLENALPLGHVSHIRELGMGDGRTPAVVPQHELDLILRCHEGRFVVEAKAWEGEVGKEEVIIFLAKTLDFMAARSFDPLGPVVVGFIGLNGFTEAAQRALFAFGVVPLTKRPEQLSFRFVHALLFRVEREARRRGLNEHACNLNEQRATLAPFLHQEGKSLSKTFQLDADAAVVDIDGIRRASDMFGEARVAHHHAMTCYREAKKAIEVDCG